MKIKMHPLDEWFAQPLRPRMLLSRNSYGLVYGWTCDGPVPYRFGPNHIGFVYIDEFEDPEMPNPVYWGDPVQVDTGQDYTVVGPSPEGREIVVLMDSEDGLHTRHIHSLKFNGRKVTEVCHGAREGRGQ